MTVRGGTAASAIVVLALTGVFLVSAFSYYGPIIASGDQYDDSQITYRYAVNLAEGRGLTYNTYERVNSASSLLYTLTLAACYRIGFHDLRTVATVIGLTSGVAVILFSVLGARQFSRRAWLAVLCLLPFAMSGSLSAWAVSGMETIFYAALVALFFLAYASGAMGLSLAAMVLCLLARPEGVILLIAVVIAEGARARLDGHYRRLATFAGVGGGVFAGWLLWNWLYYGDALPHPVALKSIALFYSPGVRSAAVSAAYFLGRNFLTIAVPGVLFSGVVAVSALFKPADAPRVALSLFVLGSLVSFALGPFSDLNRYAVHLVPILALAAIAAAEHLLESISEEVRRRSAFAIAGAGLLILSFGGYESYKEQRRMSAWFAPTTKHQAARRAIGEYIEKHVPRDEVVLSSDIGAIAYAAPTHDFIDVYGLTSRAPVVAVKRGSWETFVRDVRSKKPRWVADTGMTDGRVVAFEILGHPQKYFRGLEPRERPYLEMYAPRGEVVLEEPTGDGLVFRLIKIDPAVY